MSDNNFDQRPRQSPLCVFCLSPPFSIRTYIRPIRKTYRHPSALIWRRGDYLPAVRPRFKPSNRRTSNSLTKYIAGSLVHRRHKTLELDEILRTIQEVWKSPNYIPSSCNSTETMERKASSYSTDIPSPVLLRRRLSAPETIMRKHVLAQQRSESQDSDITQSSDTRSCQWRGEIAAGSDPNLSRKRDSGLMRKSTLLRRMWSNSKPFPGSRFSGSFYEWQHSFSKMSSGKSTHSLTSNHSSPEHKSQSRRSLNSSEFKTSPQHFPNRKMSPKHINESSDSNKKCLSPKRKMSVYNANFDYTSYSSNSTFTDNSNLSSSLDNRTSRTITPKTETENYSTRSTITSYTTLSDNSDSAFTNSQFSNNNSTTTTSEITKQFIEESDSNNQEGNQNIHLDTNSNNNLKAESVDSSKHNNEVNESGTQTSDVTNLNVISNVQLSQSTLDLIVQQVIQDVNKSAPNEISVNTIPIPNPQVINVQEVPSFYLKRKEDITVDNPEHSKIVKYMISNIGTGSPYSKPAEIPQVVVPRFSALPRTSSMEVNTSSGESDDKESDTVSLVDSLEDPHSPRIDINFNNHDEKIVRGDMSLSPILPDNSANPEKKKNKTPKPSSFFIPIESNQTEIKAVSDLLPSKVREKLAKRQQKREEKLLQTKSKLSSPRSDSNYISASDNQLHFVVDTSSDFNLNSTPNLPQVNYMKHKKRSKPLLPSIESIRRIKIDKREKESKSKPVKRKSLSKEHNTEYMQSKSKQWIPKSKNKMQEKLTPIYTSQKEYVYDAEPRRIYHKTEFSNNNKRIEILEIMECVDSSERNSQIFKGKSKIPVLINQRLPKINDKSFKPSFLDFDQVEISDPKLDQLIANILIDTLNNSTETERTKNINERKLSPSSPNKYSPNPKYQQKFEVIPEELQATSEEHQNKDISNNNRESKISTESAESNANEAATSKMSKEKATYKGKAAVAVVRDENLSTIPKGWITFYMLHKNQGSPDSTSDEGKKLFDQKQSKSSEFQEDNIIEIHNKTNNIPQNEPENNKKIGSARSNTSNKIVKKDGDKSEALNIISSSSEDITQYMPPSNGKNRKYYSSKTRTLDLDKDKAGQWSVTVSGTNSCGQLAPELEMRLKFPNSKNKKNSAGYSYSEMEEENTRKNNTNFPKVHINKENAIESNNNTYRRWLPEIPKNKLTRKKKNEGVQLSVSSGIEPKQTRTSTKRYHLTRPKIDNRCHVSPNNSLFSEREYAELLRHFPEILSIHGRSISPEIKSKVPLMSERDLSRHFYTTPR